MSRIRDASYFDWNAGTRVGLDTAALLVKSEVSLTQKGKVVMKSWIV